MKILIFLRCRHGAGLRRRKDTKCSGCRHSAGGSPECVSDTSPCGYLIGVWRPRRTQIPRYPIPTRPPAARHITANPVSSAPIIPTAPDTRYIGVLSLVPCYLAILLIKTAYALIDFASWRSQTLDSGLVYASESHFTYSSSKQHDGYSLTRSGF